MFQYRSLLYLFCKVGAGARVVDKDDDDDSCFVELTSASNTTADDSAVLEVDAVVMLDVVRVTSLLQAELLPFFCTNP
jgi:hypothetical protein